MEKFISNEIASRYGIEGGVTELVLEYDNTINCTCEVPSGTQEVNLILEPADPSGTVAGHTGLLPVKEGVNHFQSTLDLGEKGTYNFVMSVMVKKSQLASGLVCLLVDEQKATMISAEDNAYRYEYVLPHQTEKITVEPVVNDPSVVISGDVGEVPVYGSCQMTITLTSPKAAEELKVYLDITDPFAEQKLSAPPPEAPVTVAPEVMERPIPVSVNAAQPMQQAQPFMNAAPADPMMPAASAGKGDDLSNIRNIMDGMNAFPGGGQPPAGGAPTVDFNNMWQQGGRPADPVAGFNPSWGTPVPSAPYGQALPMLRSLTVFSVGGGKNVDVDKLKRMVSQADQNALSSMDRKAHLTTAVLQPEFSRENTVYTTYVSGDVTAVYISAAPEDPVSSSVSGDLNYRELRDGENGFSISVSSQNTVNTYRLIVIKAKSADPQVEAQMWQVEEAMNFNPPRPQGAPVSATYPMPPQMNAQQAPVEFQAHQTADMPPRQIQPRITGDKKAMRNPRLAQLDVSVGHLKPVFAPDKLKYTLILPTGEAPATFTLRAAAQEEGAMISGNDGENRINAGKNTYNIICTSPDGKKTRTYTVSLNCKASKAAKMPGVTSAPAPAQAERRKKQKSYSLLQKFSKKESDNTKPKRVITLRDRLAVFCLMAGGLGYASYQFLYVPSVTSFEQSQAEYIRSYEERSAMELIMQNADSYQKKMNDFNSEIARMSNEIPGLPTQQEILRDLHGLQTEWTFEYSTAQVGQVSAVTMDQMNTVISTYGLSSADYPILLPTSGTQSSDSETVSQSQVLLPDLRQAMLKITIKGELETILDVYAHFTNSDRKYTIGNIIITQEATKERETIIGYLGERVPREETKEEWSMAFDVDYYSYTGYRGDAT